MKLQGKSIVVTGASSGMGKSIVELFAKEGANIIAVARRKERLDALAESLKDQPGTVIPFVGDISREEDNVAAIEAAVTEKTHVSGDDGRHCRSAVAVPYSRRRVVASAAGCGDELELAFCDHLHLPHYLFATPDGVERADPSCTGGFGWPCP